MISFVKAGLTEPRSPGRNIKWGIPVEGEAPHVFYVWFDALTAYMSAVRGQRPLARGPPPDRQGDRALPRGLWPAFLMAAGLELPKRIFAHGWLLFEESKMSKSRGNIVRSEPIRKVMGADALRYFLLREMVFGQDGSFSYDALVGRYNSDLANGLGNLASRTLTMIQQYRGGAIPEAARPGDRRAGRRDHRSGARPPSTASSFRRAGSHLGADLGGGQVHRGTGAVEVGAPGRRAAGEQLATTLYTAAEALRIATALVSPVLPQSAPKIWAQLGMTEPIEAVRFETLAWGGLRRGRRSAKCRRFPAHRAQGGHRKDAGDRRAGHRRAGGDDGQEDQAAGRQPATPRSPSTISPRWICAWGWCFPPSASRAPTS